MSKERTNRRFYRAESMSNLLACMDRGLQAEEENRWTIEVAWEVANKGILIYKYFYILHNRR